MVFSDDLRGSAVLASGSVFAKGRTWYQITQVIFSLPENLGPIFPIIKTYLLAYSPSFLHNVCLLFMTELGLCCHAAFL